MYVHSDHLIESRAAAAINLPFSGDARPRVQNPAAVPERITFEFVSYGGPRSDQRHVAFQYIDELRQFIEAGLPDKPADGSHSWIGIDLDRAVRTDHLFVIGVADVLLVVCWTVVDIH